MRQQSALRSGFAPHVFVASCAAAANRGSATTPRPWSPTPCDRSQSCVADSLWLRLSAADGS